MESQLAAGHLSDTAPGAKTLSSLASWLSKPWVAFPLFVVLLLTRRPDMVTHPQFYADDSRFFADAYNDGWRSLLYVHQGYLHTVPRLVALLSASMPLLVAPLVMSVSAVLLQSGVAAFMLSKRMAGAAPLLLRGVLGVSIVAYPNHGETIGNMAHAQWFLAIYGLAVLWAEPPRSAWGRVLENLSLALVAVSGPLSIALAPLAIIRAKKRPELRLKAALLSAGALIQATCVLGHPRAAASGSKSPSKLIYMLAGQVVVGAIAGVNGLRHFDYSYWPDSEELAFLLVLGGVSYWLIRHGTSFVKALWGMGLFAFVTALFSGATWLGLGVANQGQRYFMLLGLAFLVGLVSIAVSERSRLVKYGAISLCAVAALAVPVNWRLPALPDFGYPESISRMALVPAGSYFDVKVPADQASKMGWTIRLRKR